MFGIECSSYFPITYVEMDTGLRQYDELNLQIPDSSFCLMIHLSCKAESVYE